MGILKANMRLCPLASVPKAKDKDRIPHREAPVQFKPMLAAEAELGSIPYPIVALPKHNGVRGLYQGGMVARSLKPIPNRYIRGVLSIPSLEGLDGELVVGDPFSEDVFSASDSGVMTQAGEPQFMWHIFDCYHPTLGYLDRLKLATELVNAHPNLPIGMIPHRVIHSDKELVAYSALTLGLGYEGLVLRRPDAPYKQGRSTGREAGFMRYCPWFRSEAEIISVEEGQVNLNPSKINELGYKRKSSHKENKVGSGRAGSVTVKDLKTGVVFSILVPSVALQEKVWSNLGDYVGKPLKYKFKPPVKAGGKPRFPQWEGIRSILDM